MLIEGLMGVGRLKVPRAGLGVRACLLVSSRRLRAILGKMRSGDDAVES